MWIGCGFRVQCAFLDMSVYLSVWTKIGQCLEDFSNHCPFPVEHLVMIYFFSWRGGRGGGGVLRVLIGGSEKKHIVILCWGTHWEPKKNEKKPSPHPRPLLPKFKRNKSKAPWVHPWAFHWLHEISIPKRVRHRLKPEWEMRRTGWGGSTRCIMHQVHTSSVKFRNCTY